MSRQPRRAQWADDACYHIINRGHNRETVFRDDEDRRVFLDLLSRYRARYGFRLYHYCLMSNHFHLLLQFGDPRQLSGAMAGFLRCYVHHFHRRHGFVGHLWQGRFKSPCVERDGYLLSCGRYIERNPVEAGLAALPWDYGWSSCRAYALGQSDPLLAESPCYLGLAAAPEQRMSFWRTFLLGEDPREADVGREDGVVGDDEFRRRLAERHGRLTDNRLGRPRGTTSRDKIQT